MTLLLLSGLALADLIVLDQIPEGEPTPDRHCIIQRSCFERAGRERRRPPGQEVSDVEDALADEGYSWECFRVIDDVAWDVYCKDRAPVPRVPPPHEPTEAESTERQAEGSDARSETGCDHVSAWPSAAGVLLLAGLAWRREERP